MKKPQWPRPSKDWQTQMADPRYATIRNDASQKCLCRACGHFFSGVRVFQDHRYGIDDFTRGCITVNQMRKKGWTRNDRGFWQQKQRDWSKLRKVLPDERQPAQS